jgi:uncharacterized protein (TIGR03437 family)
LGFDYHANSGPARPLPETATTPLFAGLTAGTVGLYQVNFTVPQSPAGLTACQGNIHSNLTVSLASAAVGGSVDGAGICVNPGE